MSTTNNDFLPQGYEVPKSEANYMKFEQGDNKFRALSKPIVGWLDWKDKKPYRFRMDNKPEKPFDPKQDIKHFWAMVVFDYGAKKIAILEITQKGVQNTIQNLALNPDWGSPTNYDITVTKSGSGMETKYATTPAPPKPVHEKIAELYANTPINLELLFEGKDPFDTIESTSVSAAPTDALMPDDSDDLPF